MKLILSIVLLTSFLLETDNPDANENCSWLKFYQLKEKEFKSEYFQDSLDLVWDTYFHISDSYRQLLNDFFIFSPDSSFFIDLDSYSLAMEKVDGKLISHGFGVDSKIQLIRVEDNMTATILFCGPSCIIETASWISSTKFYLYGFSEDQGDDYKPTRWLIDLDSMTISLSMAAKVFPSESIRYREKERLNKIEFKYNAP